MTISNHLFGLIQCYSEQGLCYYKDFGFNAGFLTIIYFGLFGIALCFLWFIAIYISQIYKNKNKNKKEKK